MLFITKPHAQEKFGTRLNRIESDPVNWTALYVDSETGEEWIEYYPYEDDRAPAVLRKKNIPTDIDVLVIEALLSPHENDWAGLGAYISSSSYKEEEILGALRKSQSKIPKAALRLFGANLRIRDRRKLDGMNYDEVRQSYARFTDICSEIQKITNGA